MLTAAVGAAEKVVQLIQRQPDIEPLGALRPSDFSGPRNFGLMLLIYLKTLDMPASA